MSDPRTPPSADFPVVTIDDAELAGWACLSVSCGCSITRFSWTNLRRHTRLRRFGEIIPRLRCSKCGQRVKEASLYWMGGGDNQDKREKVLYDRAMPLEK